MKSAHAQHAHAADLEGFLDLVNSLEHDDGVPHDHLPTAADAVEFFARRGLGHREQLDAAAEGDRTAERRLARLREVRAAAREVWDALVEHRDAEPLAIERVNAVLRHPPVVELTPGDGGIGVGHRHVGDPWDEALARTLEPFVDAVAQGHGDRFRICSNGCSTTSRGPAGGAGAA
jgi:hypothetical protein